MGSGSGPNSGGGRRTGGGGHQRGQGDVASVKLKNAKLRAEKDKARAASRNTEGSGGRGGGKDGGRGGRGGRGGGRGGGGRGGGGVDNHEVVAMTASNQELVQGLLARGPIGTPRGAHTSTIPPGSTMPTGGSGTSAVVVVDIRADVDPEDVERKTWQALEKKGFGVKAVAAAMAATKPAVDAEGDRAEGFNEQKRRRTNRGLDWLILNCEEDDLPPQFREEAQLQRKKRGGKKKGGGKDTAGGNNTAVSATDPFDGDDSIRRLAADLRFAGFSAAASIAAARATRGDGERALRDLCAAIGPSADEASASARDALAEAGAGDDLSIESIAEILRTAQRDELSSLPRAKHAPRGYTPAQLRCVLSFDVGGIVQLGTKEYLGTLALDLQGKASYPFELPSIEFTHPALRFEEIAAVNAGIHRYAAETLVGRPFLSDILEWCEGGDASVAIEAARERIRTLGDDPYELIDSELNALELSGKGDVNTKKGHGIDTGPGEDLDALRPSMVNPLSAEERAAATERRKKTAQEHAKRTAEKDASDAVKEAKDSAERTALAAKRVAELELKAASDPKTIAENQRLRRELDRRTDARFAETNPAYAQRTKLPAWAKRHELLDAISRHQVVIVAGETGCGKTTQLPQFILDDAIQRGQGGGCNLICTQPRRISATSVASRVAAERGEKIGTSVGYKIRLESVHSSSTKILFVTTGVLLRRLAEDPLLAGVSHVVVDEVHERSLDSDFLLVLLRDVLPHRPSLRVVLMSATLNAAAFSAYFKGAAVAQIPGFTHPVQEHYLEDILQVTGYVPNPGSEYCRRGGGRDKDGNGNNTGPEPAKEAKFISALSQRGYLQPVCDTLRVLDQNTINYELATKLVTHIVTDMEPGAILIFMPGLAEISKLHESLSNNPTVRAATLNSQYLIALHSTLSTAEQKVIFEHPPAGIRKIVIATNIAETSITIDDVVYVIDAGKCKENGYDPNTRMQLLLERWVSRASAKQRRGRAGRVRPGRCFRMYTRQMHDDVFDEHTMPEIKRVPLEGLCLQIQLQRMSGGIAGFLGKALEPPEQDSIKSAIRTLRQIGALDEKENLTSLGQHLASLPVDVRVGKMLLYGAVLGCLGPVLTIAAVLGGRSPFVAPLDKRDEADAAKRMFSEDQSDHLTNLNAFNAWIDAKSLGRGAEMAFTRDNFLSFRTLEGIADLRTQFAQLLHEAGFLGARAGKGGKGKGGKGGGGKKNIPAPRGGSSSDAGSSSTNKPESSSNKQPFNPRMLSRRGGPPADDPVWREANRNSSNTRLLKAVLVAGLYPNLVKVAPGHKPTAPPKLAYLSDEGREESLQVHPSSVNHGTKKYGTKWLVYHERVQTTGVYVRDCSTVTPYQLLLFGGKIEVQHANGTLSLDRWATFKAPARVGVLLKEIRGRLDGVLRDKIEMPDEDVTASGGPVVEAILQLLNTEPATAAPTNANSVYS